MAFGLGKSRISPIAIDFGTDSLKLLQIVGDSPPQLVAAASAVLPEDARTDAGARQQFLADALRGLLKSAPFKGRRAVCSIPAFQTLVQNVSVPHSDDVSLSDRVGAQLRDRFHVEPSGTVLRHYEVGKFIRDGHSETEVVCLAADRNAVNRYIELLNLAKLEVCGMQTEPAALIAAYGELNRAPAGEDESLCLVDIGAATTKIVITHGTKPVVARTVRAGGDMMIRGLCKARGLDFAEARALYMATANGNVREDAVESVFGGPAAAVAADPVESTEAVQCLQDDLKLSLCYYRNLFPDRPIDRVVFMGGGARHTEVCKSLAAMLRVPAQVADPVALMMRLSQNRPFGVSFDESQPGWTVPLGLCACETDL